MRLALTSVIGGALLVSSMGYALADPAAKPDLFALLAIPKISLDDAIKTAEQTVSGKLVKAELNNDSHPNTYRVAIADSDSRTITSIRIDTRTGKVLGTKVYHPGSRATRTSSRAAKKAAITTAASTTPANP